MLARLLGCTNKSNRASAVDFWFVLLQSIFDGKETRQTQEDGGAKSY